MYSREEIIKHKHVLEALAEQHCAVMHSVSADELLKYEHFTSLFISSCSGSSYFNLRLHLKYDGVQIKKRELDVCHIFP